MKQPYAVNLGVSAFVLAMAAIAGVSCGNTKSNPGETLEHDRYFRLDGAHGTADCAACHSKGFKAGDTPAVCVGCHERDYAASSFPDHDAFPTTCADCHTTTGWQPAMLPNHDQYFKIDGYHATLACATCHTSGYLAGSTPMDCVGCHEHDYKTTTFDHDSFPTTCADCHKTTGWQPAMVPNHDRYFKLDGFHTTLACARCHTQGYLAGSTAKDCVGCHEQDYEASRYPGHSAFPRTCADCHTTARWRQTLPRHDP